ncbi:DUF4238 domain-containing protein [Microbacterium sp. Leaf203]|uniref:DUF4238 domain-containing protein n=1 Tax=Microbacterium sp. Leaf203 TaxID=1735677 RepID=UPI0009E84F33|nr:DUF4238 domain-containing protein [Microbacterium sp. Leaf203]
MGDSKHHWVPQFYLKSWAVNGQLSTVDLATGSRYKKPVVNAAMELGFYAVPQHPDDPEVFEKLFSKLEGQAAAVLKAVADGAWPLDGDDREVLATFVTFQALRGPEQRQLMRDLQTDRVARETAAVAEMGAAAWFQDRFGLPIEEGQARRAWERATGHDEPPIRIDAQFHIEQIARLAEKALPYIALRRWKLIRFDEPALLTSDVPVSLDNPGRAHGRSGLLTARTLAYPLSRQAALVLGDYVPVRAKVEANAIARGRFDSLANGSTTDQEWMNARTVHSARTALFHHPDDVALVPNSAAELRSDAAVKVPADDGRMGE